MKYGPIRTLHLGGSPEAIGAAHGEKYASDIAAYTKERVGIVASGSWSGQQLSSEAVVDLAGEMAPAHEHYSESLFAEMSAMANAAGISPAEAIVVGGFTDFVDTVRGVVGAAPYEDTCTAVIVPAAAAEGGAPLLGQTWDMHDTATEYVVMLDIRPDVGPDALVFTTVGCLGQIGMNDAGIAVGINNLTAAAGTRGVTWPFVVRKALQQTTLTQAVECVLEADLAGAHNFLLVDGSGEGVNVEAMPQHKVVTKVTERPYIHTNHTLDDGARAHEAKRPSALTESSRRRLERAEQLLEGNANVGPDDLKELTRDHAAVCQKSTPPYNIESCGAAVMRPGTGDLWAVWGRPDMNEYEHFELAAS